MATNITLPFWPACPDNVKWSRDGIIAIAGSESIAFLSPALKNNETTEPSWRQQIVKVNAFDEGELRIFEPLSFDKWSVGEELSQRFVESMAWSSPGLGVFGSCCLAVLHSDHSLDLWECRGRPEHKDDWHKCLVITTAVSEHYEKLHSTKSAREKEDCQIRQRIRSFAWEPEALRRSTSRTVDGLLNKTTHRMAVATEAGEILILRITSPYGILSSTGAKKWVAEIQSKISCIHDLPQLDRTAAHEYLLNNNLIEQLNWSSINEERGQGSSNFAFLANGSVHLISLHLPIEAIPGSCFTPSCPTVTGPNDRVEGPLRISPDGRYLLFWMGDVLTAHDLATRKVSGHEFTRGWSQISALTFQIMGDTMQVYPVTQLAYERLPAIAVHVKSWLADEHGPEDATIDTQAALSDAITEYIAKNEVCGGVHTRTWGIDMAPHGSHLTYCTNMVPAESVSHLISATQTCHAFICSTESQDDNQWHKSLEGTLFTLQDQSSKRTAAEISHVISTMITNLAAGAFPSHDDLSRADPTTSAVLTLQRDVLYHPDHLSDVRHRLEAIVADAANQAKLSQDWYRELTSTALQVAMDVPRGPLSKRLLHIYWTLQARLSSNPIDPKLALPSDIADVQEQCSICKKELKFEAVKWAQCESGHRFTRCALTMLAIPRQDVGKRCIVCSTQYLNEHKLSELEPSHRQSADPAITTRTEEAPLSAEPDYSLVRVLFAVFSRCVLCHGRFVA